MVITHTDEITVDWLTAILNTDGCLPQGQITTIETIRSMASGMEGKIRLQVEYSSDAPVTAPRALFLKLTQHGDHEVKFYRSVAQHFADLPVVRCYGAEAEGDFSYLLLEDLSATHFAHPPAQIPPPEIHCEMIVDALAQLHAFWWEKPQLGVEIGNIPTVVDFEEASGEDTKVYEQMGAMLGDRLPPVRRQIYENILQRLPATLTRRFADHHALTINFEDVHIGNFLYPHNPQTHRLYFVDWEQWGVNIGVHDLAYMMGVFWSAERRSRLEISYLRRYLARLEEYGVKNYTWEQCWADYRLSMNRLLLHVAWQSQSNLPVDVWWNHLERLFVTYEELACHELLA